MRWAQVEHDLPVATWLMAEESKITIVLWPKEPGTSVKNVVGPDGIVYQKNLGANTESIARKMTAINPGLSWIPVR